MDFIEIQVVDDITKLQELVKQDAYDVKTVKIVYNPLKYTLRELEEVQHFLEKHFVNVPISFEESDTNKNISFVLGIE
ncbi:MAG: hypothetical protein KJ666_14065 [Bacteroidetes bacterium]|nr:hypothetical protein [Bacteroidota bacterium]MBU2584498.1 hypothetical protein [Bacteroidota bacterium]